jgi:predicted alpha/beta superfamily hydrolase
MKTSLLRALMLVPLLVGTALAREGGTFPPHTIANSELRVLPKSATGRQYQLHVGLPESYAKNPDRKYPVVYVTDGYWDFQKITASEGSLWYDRVVPEFITIGIGYPGENVDYGTMRGWELSPVPLSQDSSASGHAAEFLKSIESEIIPFVEKEYRADPPHRVLGGASLGGLFTLYTMFTRPELFQGYIAATPAVIVGNGWLFDYEQKFAVNRRPIRARLFMAVGGNEHAGFVGGVLQMNQLIAGRKYEGLAYEFRIVDGERHAGMQEEAYNRGLRFVFAPLAPESGPSQH